jgi:hypothetical protein
LILAGGWIEALQFATEIAIKYKNDEVIIRIGEQRATLENLIMLLREFSSEEDYSLLADELQSLYDEFDNITYNYQFIEPSHDNDNMLTTIKGKRSVEVSPEALQVIADKVKDIRTKIVESNL